MNALHSRIHLGDILRRILDWIAETTRESRSARLSTLGLSSYAHNGDGFEHPMDGHHCR